MLLVRVGENLNNNENVGNTSTIHLIRLDQA
jgi:hypothetical protein